jgi:outer membrane protein TolC
MNRKIKLGVAGAFALLGLLATAAPAAEPQVRELTLNECVGIALENNLDLRIEKIARQIVRLDGNVARGGYDPTLALTAGRNYEKTAGESAGTAAGVLDVLGAETETDALGASLGGTTALGGLGYEVGTRLGDSSGTRKGDPFDTSTGSAGITLTQPLLKGFKTDDVRYRVAVADKQSAEAAVQLEGRLQAILAQVETAWYALIQARESIRVQEDAVRLATQLYEDNQRKVQIGALSILDEKQAESQAATARAALSATRLAYAEAQNQLKSLVFADHRQFRGLDIEAVGELSAEPVATDVEASGTRALENRPDLRQARMALERQNLTVKFQRNQTLPALDLVGGYGLAASSEDSYASAVDEIGSGDEPYWNAGVTLSFPLGNRAEKNRHAQSLETAEKMQLQMRQLEETALVEVDNAVASVVTGLEQVQATKEARTYAEQALAAEQRKFASGKSTSFVVLQLQRDLTLARHAEIRALAEYNQQLSALALAEGAMLARHGVEFSDPK